MRFCSSTILLDALLTLPTGLLCVGSPSVTSDLSSLVKPTHRLLSRLPATRSRKGDQFHDRDRIYREERQCSPFSAISICGCGSHRAEFHLEATQGRSVSVNHPMTNIANYRRGLMGSLWYWMNQGSLLTSNILVTECLSKAMRLFPSSTSAYFLMGKFLVKEGRARL